MTFHERAGLASIRAEICGCEVSGNESQNARLSFEIGKKQEWFPPDLSSIEQIGFALPA
jgi:hypothetical protein